jgi:PKD repeat protein
LQSIRSRIVATALAGTLFAAFANLQSAQLGHVVSAQKISSTSGGFTAQLDEEDQFGRSIVNLGDLDGDGVTDLLVGAHTDDDGGIDKGSVYVLCLRSNGYVKSWQKISDLSGNFAHKLDPGDQFGRAAANLGDLDGDGVTDVVVSSNYDDDGGTNKGAVYVLFLNRDGSVKGSQKISQTSGGLTATLHIHDEFGRSLTSLGDLDLDGVPDIVVGTPEDDEGGTNTGALHVLFLNRNGTVKAYHRVSRGTEGLRLKPGDWFGHASANLGDFDHDGIPDLVVGAILDDDGGVNRGAVWILLLRRNGSVREAHKISQLTGGFTGELHDIDQFGTSVSPIGDLDGDGVTDIAVGTVKDDDGGSAGNPDADVGAVYVLLLNVDCTVKQTIKISDTQGDLPYALDQYDWFGSALARLGGSSGDGLFNLAIGCRNDDDGSPNRGSVFLVQLNDGTAPAAEFTASKTTGALPMTVSFGDTSTGEITAWLWNFNDGLVSNQRNPVKTFNTPGAYDVTLTVKGPKGKDSETKHALVHVSAGPLADFSASATQGLAPLDVQFTDRSEGVVMNWSWSFGDGASSSQASPRHLYASAGTFTVALTVSGPNGADTKTRVGLISVQDLAPLAAFGVAPATGVAPLAVQFDDRSSGLVDGWTWNFGDGTSSNERNPKHTYSSVGPYTVQLTARGPYGTNTRTLANAVVVQSPVPHADLGALPTTGQAPLAVQFTDLSTGLVTSRTWDFGDGLTSSETNPRHVYDFPGVYSVRLTSTGPLGSDSTTRTSLVTVTEPPPSAEFVASSSQGFAPCTLDFTDQSSGTVTSYLWSFGDGATSTSGNPSHTYTLPGAYSVSLQVKGPFGHNTTSKTDYVVVEDPMPVAAFHVDTTSGVAPLAVQFTDDSTGLVNAWQWSFGDGASSAQEFPTHTYAAPGTYTVALTASGPSGTNTCTKAGLISALFPPPIPEFNAGPVTGFAPLTVAFTDLSSGTLTSWSWNFGDNTTSRARFPTKVYTRTGAFNVTLTVKGPGGSRTVTHGGIVVVPAPIVVEGGFEASAADSAPKAPWTVVGGASVLARALADGGFPRDGLQWCDIGADGSAAASPASSPGNAGTMPSGAAGLQQVFAFQPLAPYLLFDAAFLLGELPASPARNDFMSVDVTDGTTTWNLYAADTFSSFPGTSLRYGLPMTSVQRVHVDLRTLFPGALPGTLLTLRASVGNGGDGANPSRGYVDAFRLVPAASASFRNGTGRNAPRYTSSPAVLGGSWTIQVDTTGHAGARLIQLVGLQRPSSGALTTKGEVLTSGKKLFAQSWPATPGLNVRTIALPIDLALVGVPMATQVTISGGVAELTNAYDLVLGF